MKIMYVEDGSVDVNDLQEKLGDSVLIVQYRQGATPPIIDDHDVDLMSEDAIAWQIISSVCNYMMIYSPIYSSKTNTAHYIAKMLERVKEETWKDVPDKIIKAYKELE